MTNLTPSQVERYKKDPVAFAKELYPNIRMDPWQEKVLRELSTNPGKRLVVFPRIRRFYVSLDEMIRRAQVRWAR